MSPTIIEKPQIKIKEEILTELQQLVKEESQVVVHCLFKGANAFDSFIRIWPSTFLFDEGSPHRSKLVHVEKITLFPTWMKIPAGSSYNFSLIFSGLPSDCNVFSLKELIPQKGGFEVEGISRNETDVYFVNI